jgi:spore germination protein YaaH
VDTLSSLPRRSTARSALGLLLGLLLVAPQAPVAPVAASAAATGARLGATADAAPADTSDADPASTGDLANGPSVQYLDSLAHAGDRIDFQPGARVSVPFRPRAADHWSVDGGPPRALPAGRLSGAEMRDAAGPPAPSADPSAAPDTTGADAAVPTAPLALAETTAAVGAGGLSHAVLGFLPYWEVGDSSTNLDYPTLSTIAYFSVGCASGGNLLKKNSDGSTTTGWAGWTSSKMTSVINAAHTTGTRVALTLTCFGWSSAGATLQAKILNTASYRANLAAQVAKAVHDRGADGVNLDFEPLVSGTEDGFVAFIRSLRTALNGYAPGYELTFDTMGFIGNYPIADATASGAADALMIMGYDYRSMGTSTVGSISPLSGPPYDLTDTIASYEKHVSASKIILGLPYYGRAWSTDSSAIHAHNISGAKYGKSVNVTYATALGVVADHGRKWDSIEQSPWSVYQKQTCTTTYGCVTAWRQLYYDDAQSLGLKYDLINRTGIRGAGIWALGYDGNRDELHQMLADKFLHDTTPPLTGVTNMSSVRVDEGFVVSWKGYDDTAVASYDVQVSRDGGGWATWLTDVTRTSDVYLGSDGHTYAFRVRATDSLGNTSAWDDVAVTGLGTPSSLGVGRFGRVTTDGLHMRASPSTGATSMATLAKGATLWITGGPKSADGYTWYRVNGPVRQWGTVDPIQLGGWVAASGNGSTNLVPRAAVYATHVAAGIVDYTVGAGGDRLVTPDGDGVNDSVRLAWTNTLAFDGLTLRVFASDGSLLGTKTLAKLDAGPQAYDWNGTLGGSPVAAGSYVLQLVGTKGSATYTAPSASPVTQDQLTTYGIAVASVPPTSVFNFEPTIASPTRASTLTYGLVFGASVTGLSAADFSRGGTATGCVVNAPTGSGATYAISVTKCSAGTVILSLKANSVTDAVANTGPEATTAAATVLIDRTAPTTGLPRTGLIAGGTFSGSTLAGRVTWSASDTGGAGVASYDVERSVDGGAFAVIATGLASPSLAVGLSSGHTYRFAVRARDHAGNIGSWKGGATTSTVVRQESSSFLAYAGSWHTATSSHFAGGAVRYATTLGAAVQYTFTGRSIAFVTTLAPTRGVVRLYLDGAFVANLDTGSATVAYREILWSRTFPTAASHTIRLVVLGTAGRPRVDLDAFLVLR